MSECTAATASPVFAENTSDKLFKIVEVNFPTYHPLSQEGPFLTTFI